MMSANDMLIAEKGYYSYFTIDVNNTINVAYSDSSKDSPYIKTVYTGEGPVDMLEKCTDYVCNLYDGILEACKKEEMPIELVVQILGGICKNTLSENVKG